MRTLREVVGEYQAAKKALGHFNISDSNQLKAIASAAREAGLPVLVGLSEGEREYFTLVEARALVDAHIQEGVSIYLSADHTYTEDKAKAAIDAGVDAVVVDGAKLSFEDNAALVKTVLAYARASGRDVMIEGELGYIGQRSALLDELPQGVTEANLTTADEARRFVEATGADLLAPAVGNIHGMLKHAAEPRLHADRVAAIAAAAKVPLVLHGASGNSDDDVRACIEAGVAIVHINTELRVEYRDALEESLAGEETTPYKFLAPAVGEMRQLVAHKLRLFAGA